MDIKNKIDCFVPCDNAQQAQQYATQFINEDEVAKVFMLTSDDINGSEKIAEDIGYIHVDNILSTETMLKMAQKCYCRLRAFLHENIAHNFGLPRFNTPCACATDTKAALTYADRIFC